MPYPTPPRTPRRNAVARRGGSSIASRVAAQAAINAVSAFSPSAGTALRVARTIRQAYNMYNKRRATKKSGASQSAVQSAGLGSHWGGHSTGYYQGKFRKPTSRVKGLEKLQNYYMSTGTGKNIEIEGKVDDVDCVYVGHSTYCFSEMAANLCTAMLRKLFKKAGFDVEHVHQELPLYSHDNADGFKVQLVRLNGDGSKSVAEYITVDNDTLNSIAITNTWSGLSQKMFEIIQAAIDPPGVNAEFESLILYSSDRNGVATNWRLASELDLRREKVEMYISSELTVQNRTKTADGGSTSTDTIDNQPLKGKLYQVRGGIPKMKIQGRPGLNYITDKGVILQQAIDLTPSGLFKEPPPRSIFSNVTGTSYVSLDPGTIKKTRIAHKYQGYFNYFIQRVLNMTIYTNSGTTISNAKGKAQFIALEERLNSGSANKITVCYEIDQKVFCKLKTTKKPTALPDYGTSTYNNVTA